MKLLQLPLSCTRVAVGLFIVGLASIAILFISFLLHAAFIARTVPGPVALAIFYFSLLLVPFVGFMLVFRYPRWLSSRTELVRWIASAVLALLLAWIFSIAMSLSLWYLGVG